MFSGQEFKLTKKTTERKGFEPLLPSPINSLSRTAPSTTRPSLQNDIELLYKSFFKIAIQKIALQFFIMKFTGLSSYDFFCFFRFNL